ncbi:MAG: T9SS type A sorting domain-containing protein [Bacteroidetes bacterium]|nr:T9SS type A sorting domain-containing protein [Bacteroidota bacterium]
MIAGANLYYYPATLNGNYSVLSTDANGCESTFEIQNIILSNLSIENSGFTVFPNPASSEFIVDPGAVNSSRMDILNSIGRVISSQLLTSGKNKISTSDIAPGIYFIRVTVGERSHIQKIMIIN